MRNKGFLLMDVLIGVGILMVMLPVMMGSVLSFYRQCSSLSDRVGQWSEYQYLARFVRYEVLSAYQVSATPDVLSLLNEDGQRISYQLKSQRLQRKAGGSSSFLTQALLITSFQVVRSAHLVTVYFVTRFGQHRLDMMTDES